MKGQKPDRRNVIPPRGSITGLSSHAAPPAHHPADEHPVENHPTEQRPLQPPAADDGGDLIDFGQNDAAPPPVSKQSEPQTQPESRPPIDANHRSTAEIQSMLSQTGAPAPGGPLIDFHQDMKKTLPAGLQRADTAESNDEFVDAHE